ncbi:AMP-binding protein [Nonomuraea sp. NPDC050786]|uniref:class I adenylate-forming enzyme family protein n=1 Tax=Nonomuraea sp. NPDC050786 TaxID=3154840 RepID=UPI0033DAEF1B
MTDGFHLRLVHEMLQFASTRAPGAPAVRDQHGSWTYAEFLEQSLACAGWLSEQGVGHGDRVMIRARPDRRVLAVLFACARLGAVFVPVSETATAIQVNHILSDADPVVVIDDELPDWGGHKAPGAQAARDDPLLLIYTSGSTAVPKAVVGHHSHVLFATRAIAERLSYRADDVVLCKLPLSFDYGLYQAFLTVLCGAELVLAGQDADARLLALIKHHGVTVVPVVPSLAAMLLSLGRRDRSPTRVRLFTNTGEELPRATIAGLRERFSGAGVQLMFGITECKRVSIMEVDGDLHHPGALGRPLRGTSVRILRPDGSEAPTGESGEIMVSGPHVMAGYWRDPELSARFFCRDPLTGERWLRTGDHGWLDAEGYLHFDGRRDQIFKLHGTRVSALEIEAAAREIPGVSEAAVVPPAPGREAALLVIASLTPVEVLRALRARLDASRTPSVCRVVARLPRNTSGKLDRAALPELLMPESAINAYQGDM